MPNGKDGLDLQMPSLKVECCELNIDHFLPPSPSVSCLSAWENLLFLPIFHKIPHGIMIDKEA